MTSIMFAAVGAMMLAFPPEGAANPVAMMTCVLVFAPLAFVYAFALWRRRSGEGSAA
jgi:hypothetical protein